MLKAFRYGAWTLALSASLVSVASAATWTVTTLADSGPGSLRDAINLAAADDQIHFQPGLTGTVTLSTPLSVSRSVQIRGNGAVTLNGANQNRHFDIASNVDVTLADLVLEDGMASDGGAIFSQGRIRLANLILRNNTATSRGGALFVASGNYVITGCLFESNNSTAEGGAWVDFSTAPSQILDSIIAGNFSNGAGGAARIASGQPLTIQRTRFQGNIAGGTNLTGGAISSQNSFLTIEDSTFAGNKAVFGGGVYASSFNSSTTLRLSRSLLLGNSAEQAGGGLFVFGGEAFVTNTTIAHNLSPGGAGMALQNTSSVTANVTLTNTTIAQNRATDEGGGISRYSGTLALRASIVAGNTAPTNTDTGVSFTSLGNNLVQVRGTSSGYVGSDLANGTNPMLGALRDNGGATLSMAPNTGSPLINAVAQANCAQVPDDQRGFPRPATLCDIGAIEANATSAPVAMFADAFE